VAILLWVVCDVVFWVIVITAMCLPEFIAERRYLAARKARRVSATAKAGTGQRL
jgi:hypothetical protein